MSHAHFLNENDLPEEPPRKPGGPVRRHVMVEKDPREVIIPVEVGRTVACSHRELVDALHELITTLRGIADTWTQQAPKPPDNDSPGPAKGLITQIRPTPEHRNPNGRSNLGFAPPKAQEHTA